MSHRHLPRQPDRIHDPAPHNHHNPTPLIQNALPPPPPPANPSIIHKLNTANEQTWLLIGRVAEQMGDLEHALSAYENALRHNPTSVSGLTQVAGIARIKENYPKAVDFFQRVLGIEEDNGEIWSALGHCYLMQDDLQKAYSAYQQALYLLPNPKEDPKLWYGIGILYDRYGSLDHAEEAFASVLRMSKDLDFDKENEILFRLGIIYKQQGKFQESLECFDRILRNPPSPLAHADIWFQIGHVFEQQKNHVQAKDAYERVVEANPGHAKVLQQLGWLYHQDGSSFQNQDLAIQYLTKSLEADPSDAQSWYLLGRAYMAGQKYNKAYEAYQQAVYRDGRNPTFWCSIGVLYFQINQFRDALDAYSRAIRINPYISEVWFDLGSLYESCNNQITDAIDAYARASELDPSNAAIAQRLQLLKNAQATGTVLPAAPGPQDVHPTAYASSVVPPPGPPLTLQTGNLRPPFRTDSRGPSNEISLPPPPQASNGRVSPPPPFKGGPPPPVILDESRHMPSHTPLAPMEVDRPPLPGGRDYPPSREHTRGPSGHHSLLLQHPLPPQHSDDPRNGGHPQHPDQYYNSRGGPRPHSRSISPAPQSGRPRSPPPPNFQNYPPHVRQPMGPAQPSAPPPQRSPHVYHRRDPSHPEPEPGWDRRPPGDHRDWEHDRRPRHGVEYMQQGAPQNTFYQPRSPRAHSPPEPSPRGAPRYWDNKPPSHPGFRQSSPPPPPQHQAPHSEPPSRRYDPTRHDARDYDMERESSRSYPVSPEGMRARNNVPAHMVVGSSRTSESPHATPMLAEAKERRRRTKDDGHLHQSQSQPPQTPQQHTPQPPPPPPPHFSAHSPPQSIQESVPKKDRRKRVNGSKRKEDEGTERQKAFAAERGMPGSFKAYPKGPGSPENSSHSGSSRSIQPSPTGATPRPPSRVLDENYDEGVAVADALIGLATSSSFRTAESSGSGGDGPAHSPTISSHSGRLSDPSPRPAPSHRNSVSSNHTSPPSQSQPLKRALSPGPEDDNGSKRSRLDMMKQRRISSPSGGRRTPIPSTRPSPIPFRTQLASHSPEAREPFPPSPSLPAVLPPHPRPIGAGHASQVQQQQQQQQGGGSGSSIALPPIATLSPASSAPSPVHNGDDKMHVDAGARSMSPPSAAAGGRGKMGDVMMHRSSRSPPDSKHSKQSQSPPLEKPDASS
ncbi:General transcriptional corepressor ssn6 [Psilocybe cubensis]|uniref:General transcriptional corepressor ssn6 n=2 Tax=Psilocybe cubensis TaxID=181762 RepID=A0ACB8HHJ0_PSICU|nr:General transcriptional corepressor ssn6 [Psilocybe cubensis]KAH9487170.1 General transcriptional corepressor ssn6 [Psilocybe cubensis]